MKRRFSLKNKLLLVFGLLISAASVIQGIMAVRTAHKAVAEKIMDHLTDKAGDVAEIVDGNAEALLQFFEGLARMPFLRETAMSYEEKTKLLEREAAFNDMIEYIGICDMKGKRYSLGGLTDNVSDREWFRQASNGKRFIAEPRVSAATNNLQIIFGIPIYGDNKTVIGVLSVGIPGLALSNEIKDIVVGTTGECYILGLTGTTVAHKTLEHVQKQLNIAEEAKNNPAFASLAAFTSHALTSTETDVAYYDYAGISYIASFGKMKTTGWTVVIRAPVNEFMGTVNALKNSMILIAAFILASALVIVYFVAAKMVKPVKTAVAALKDIAQGEGDLTVRLPLIGNDEVTDLSEYFNETIQKIALSITAVGNSTVEMTQIGNELASNMTESASAINQISANIDGMKQQTLTQSASVTETAATMEEIIRTIKQLNTSIEAQTESVAQSSSAVEEMVANIASIGQTLQKTDIVIKDLASATGAGKETLVNSNTVTQKILEESGSLMEASSVIQHIASQTNLLAMNAAIEAAHAGEAGKGFAVVADEIRKLAEESSAQGKAITTTLKTLSGEIETLSAASKTVEEKFNVIFNLSGEVKEMSAALTAAMREQENGSREVLAAIRDINRVTVEVKDGSVEMLKGGEEVAAEMQKLDNLTRLITDSMNEMAAGAVQINNAVQEVNEITQKNKNSIDSLSQEVKQFKV